MKNKISGRNLNRCDSALEESVAGASELLVPRAKANLCYSR